MAHKEIFQSLLAGKILKQCSSNGTYLFKMLNETLYYTVWVAGEHGSWRPVQENVDFFNLSGEFSLYTKRLPH